MDPLSPQAEAETLVPQAGYGEKEGGSDEGASLYKTASTDPPLAAIQGFGPLMRVVLRSSSPDLKDPFNRKQSDTSP